jgi:protein-tyrosine phosphatase
MALGVPTEVALTDYLKSNEYRRSENEQQLAELRRMIAAKQDINPTAVNMSKFNQLFYQEASYFEAALDEVNKLYGSFENYLEKGLGLNQSQVQKLRDQFTK